MLINNDGMAKIQEQIDKALNSDTWAEDSENAKNIRMMEAMLNYIKLLNINHDVFEQYLRDVERYTASNFCDWAYENGFGNGVY